MRYRGMGGLLVAMVLAACSPAPPPAPASAAEDPSYAAGQQQWRVARYQDLTRPDGWTALVGLHWLQNRSHFVGSGATNGIRGGGAGQAGPAAPRRQPMVVHSRSRYGRQPWGKPVRGRIRIDTDKDPQPTLLAFDGGKGQLSIIRRGPRDALRVKHADAPARRGFAGLEYWPGGPDWQVQARFIAHPPARPCRSSISLA